MHLTDRLIAKARREGQLGRRSVAADLERLSKITVTRPAAEGAALVIRF